MPSFHNVLFPPDISYGSSGGPGFNTTIIELASGYEQRNINWSEARAKYDVSFGVKTREQMEELQDFFYARRGKAYGFLYKDWMDYRLDGLVVNGSGKIIKRYEPATSYYYDRVIRHINYDDLVMTLGGNPVDPEDVVVDPVTGLVTISGGSAVGAVFVSGEFLVPVRFDIDELPIIQDDFELMSVSSIPLIELKPRDMTP